MKKVIMISLLFLVGCTDADRGSLGVYGESADIFCYSGGKEIFRDKSTGKISILEGGSGWHYRSTNGEYVRTFADCFVSVR